MFEDCSVGETLRLRDKRCRALKKYRSPLKLSNRCAPFKTFKAGTRSEIYAQNLVTFAGDRRRYLGWVFEAKKRFDLSVLNYIVTSNHIPLLVKDTGPECYCSLRTGYAHHERNSLNRFAQFKSFRKLTCALSARSRQLVHKSFANLSRRKQGMAFSRPKAIGGLAVDNDYRDDAQSASVVCRNQLGNPFSVVFVLRAGARSDVSVAQPVVSFVSRAVRHASLRRDVDLQDRHTSLEPGSLHRPPHRASRIGLNRLLLSFGTCASRPFFSQFLNVGLFRILCASPKSANEKRDPKCTKPEDL